MNIEYIENNGYVIETECAIYVFDFVEGNLSGHYLRSDKPLLFIVSKDDPNYFSQSILSYDKTTIFSDDFQFAAYRKVFMMGADENIHFGFAQLFSFDSGNGGKSFLIKEKGVSIFYGGSMGIAMYSTKKRYQDLKENYMQAISKALEFKPVDVLLFGVDPNNQVDFDEAARYAIVGMAPKAFFPLRFGDQRDLTSLKEWAKGIQSTQFYWPRHSNRKFVDIL